MWVELHAVMGLLGDEFADLPNLTEVLRICLRLTVAALLSGALGWQRERTGKEAGLRTHMLVGLGAALFALIPQQAGMQVADMSRVIQGIATGIGFVGAGAILKLSDQGEVRGLTTAAGIWLTAAIGMAAGMGLEATAVLGTILALFILAALVRAEKWFQRGALAKTDAQGAPGNTVPRRSSFPDNISPQ